MSARLNADMIAGLLFVLIGCCFLVGSFELPYGTWRKIGPGAFPALIAVSLITMGVIVFLTGRHSTSTRAPIGFQVEKLFVITASIVVFGLVLRGGGLLPAVLCCSFIAAFASRPFRPVKMAIYGVLLGAVCSVVFIQGLGMPVPMIGPWFGW